MKGFLITHPGMEDLAALEVKDMIHAAAEKDRGIAIFPAKTYEEIAKLAYFSQSAWNVSLFLGKVKTEELIKDSDVLISLLKDALPFFKESFAVECTKFASLPHNSQDLAAEAGSAVWHFLEQNNRKPKVQLNNPDVLFHLFVNDESAYFGIDFCGFDLSKRDYKLFSHPQALKGTVSYALVRASGFIPGKVFLDPFCGSGTVPIEAVAFASHKSINFYKKDKFQFVKYGLFDMDSFFSHCDAQTKKMAYEIYGFDHQSRHVDAAKRNAKIGDFLDFLTFSRADLHYLDMKFDENTVDCIATQPPFYSSAIDEKKVDKLLEEFFFIAQDILKTEGTLALFCPDVSRIKDKAEKQKLMLSSIRKIETDNNCFEIGIFVNKK